MIAIEYITTRIKILPSENKCLLVISKEPLGKYSAVQHPPKDANVSLRSTQDNYGLLIQVIDEGCGIDESIDLFAPFNRQGNKGGVGLGLFLAKSAADTLGAVISLENRKDGVLGTIATLQLDINPTCKL